MTSKERLTRQARGQEVDVIPSIGGWMHNLRSLAGFAGISVEQYLADPLAGVIRANKALGCDAITGPIVPKDVDQIRSGAVEQNKFAGIEPEALKDHADKLPDSEKGILAKVDHLKVEQNYRKQVEPLMARLDGMELIPTFWEIGGGFPLYGRYGYEAFLMTCSLYPEAVEKIWWVDSIVDRFKAEILVKLYREYDWAPLLFSGHDQCNNKGPMVSPEFLRQRYWPHVKRITEPLVEADIRLIHHCDGDVRALTGDFVASGFSGFQGFQYEVGVDPYELKRHRGPRGQDMLFFAGLSVTRTLPFGTDQDIRDEVDYLFDATDAGTKMFLFTSNVTGWETPPENIETAYRYAKTLRPGVARANPHRKWPYGVKHPEVLQPQ